MLANILRSQSRLALTISRSCSTLPLSRHAISLTAARPTLRKSPALVLLTTPSRNAYTRNTRGERGARDTRNTRSYEPEPSPNKCLFLGGLNYSLTEKEIEEVFSKFGEVVKTRIGRHPDGESRGFGYVEFQELDDAIATRGVHDTKPITVGRHAIRVSYSKTGEALATGKPFVPKIRHEEQNETLFVERVPYKAEESDLEDIFSEYGSVKRVHILKGEDGRSRGVAFVEYHNVEDAAKARERSETEQFELFDRKLHVTYSDTSRRPKRSERSSKW
ncbi:hypothetical protein BDQ17DRAFT_1375961 [Cyathus striatus]|nr:hypothetical protein BDQ17DRAFT_1375961 [Cyathus striatus]